MYPAWSYPTAKSSMPTAGAIVIPRELLDKLPVAIDLMARREKVILDAARQPGFGVAKLRDAFTASDQIK